MKKDKLVALTWLGIIYVVIVWLPCNLTWAFVLNLIIFGLLMVAILGIFMVFMLGTCIQITCKAIECLMNKPNTWESYKDIIKDNWKEATLQDTGSGGGYSNM